MKTDSAPRRAYLARLVATACLLLTLLVLALPSHAQQAADTQTAAALPAEDRLDESQAFDLPLVTNLQDPESDPTLQERFDKTLTVITDGVSAVLFRDISFGAFKSVKLDEEGQPVYEQEPVNLTAKASFEAVLTTRSGVAILNEAGEIKTVTVSKGSRFQPVSPDGVPKTNASKNVVASGPELPFLVIFLVIGAIFFTFWHGFINIRGFKHAIDIVRGKFTSKADDGDIPPFRALTSALSATVGLGNIAGVALAVKTGGPGAIFWMMFLGVFGMTAKFHESALAQLFRIKNPDGSVSGGPMYYLDHGFKQMGRGIGGVGKVLAVIFAVFCIGAALGGGNMFQSNQAFEGFYSQFVKSDSLAEQKRSTLPDEVLRPLLTANQLKAGANQDPALKSLIVDGEVPRAAHPAVRAALDEGFVRAVLLPSQIEKALPAQDVEADQASRDELRSRVSYGFGLVFASMVGIVVVGGITRIGAATSRIVPAMCLLYVAGCAIVILFNLDAIPGNVAMIFTDAFALDSAYGGFIGVLVIGFTRAAFSSEAGLGSSAIAHSAAQQSEPIREGFVASLEPFIDTIVICFMTAMVVLLTGAYAAPELIEESNGAAVTLFAFEQTRLGAWFPYLLSVCIILFAFSTMISWCYYGERAWGYLIGLKSVMVFRLIFVACVFIGSVAGLDAVIGFSDVMLLSMALPNIIGGVVLAGLVRRELKSYWSRYRRGEMATGKADDANRSAGSDI